MTEKARLAGCWKSRFLHAGRGYRQILYPVNSEVQRGATPQGVAKQLKPRFQEKSLSDRHDATVPQTDTGGQVENTKALERTWVKELGKMTP